ncbi:aldose 1-epimerase [Shimia gijangensis]|uniref:Aldose 1-epimerase n=1 Tax=Shimia gijangensis TaxID=1470563 RepID=A0A1M6CKM1_9RHOB|nr:aldose epimerase family protein [Shimia gijangensis]SHI61546.1 aldose 1-epimerase [Shimia gijangensis]
MNRVRSPSDEEVRKHVLSDGDVSVSILNLGCITQDWRVPVEDRRIPVVLGYSDPESYLQNPYFMGAIVGRVANRIGNARYTLHSQRHDLSANEGAHCLHGGAEGIGTRFWTMAPDGDKSVRLHLTSQNRDQGFPGTVAFQVTITLSQNSLTYDMRADADQPTPINLAQHSYYNLMGKADVRDHVVDLNAARITALDKDNIATGPLCDVADSQYDFTAPRRFRDADSAGDGYDINYVLSQTQQTAATVTAPNGLRLTLETDQPCVQLYTARNLSALHTPLAGQFHAPYCGFCLETQGFPNAVNVPAFASTIVTPERPYRHQLKVTICQD